MDQTKRQTEDERGIERKEGTGQETHTEGGPGEESSKKATEEECAEKFPEASEANTVSSRNNKKEEKDVHFEPAEVKEWEQKPPVRVKTKSRKKRIGTAGPERNEERAEIGTCLPPQLRNG